MPCSHCRASIPQGSRFCPGCGQPTGEAAIATALLDDDTRLASAPQTPFRPPSSDSGWLTASGSIDHGRFGPGAIFDNRYRVLGLLGRGGMGEVYHADDLRLGQQVALKFLPADLSRDPVRLAQFHNEVRTARQVSHPNVCRVYDIGEFDGQLFITMEYVDGEDLSILLRRIGRLPEDKGLEIARQICAGLAAAHERGVLHRDLKPANIMLDGAGKVRIMDFSLAAVGEVSDIRAGTPAYMAPEQLAGQEVTVRSDIYALGLVLYEIFTGKRAFEAKTLSDLIEQHHAGMLTTPTSIVKSLDPAIETSIVRCLDPLPPRRPPSAIAVSASLPGGDPLAAALAAGETPSPEMVAAAGGDEMTLSIAKGVTWLAVTAAILGVFTWMAGRYSLLSRVPLAKSDEVLADRAEELRQSFGYTDPPQDRASGFIYDDAYIPWAAQHGSGRTRWSELPTGRPAVVRYWYRTSPRPLVPMNPGNQVGLTDPPFLMTGMTKVIVDSKGRLLRFEAMPPQVESPAAASRPVDWKPLFAAAAIDPATFTEAVPTRTPASFADERKAWNGTLPDTNVKVTIEAAGYRGRPVMFDIVAPWTQAAREPDPGRRPYPDNTVLVYFLLIGASLIAVVHVRRGRADQRGAFRLAIFTFFLVGAMWLVGPHVNDTTQEQQRLFNRLGMGLFLAGALYLLYLGLEPFVRRAWPSMLVGWSRLLSGRVRDPLIGHDIVVGVACGAALSLLGLAASVVPPMFGLPEPPPHTAEFGALMGIRFYLLTFLACINVGLQNALITLFEFSVVRAIVEWSVRGVLRLAAARSPRAARRHLSDRALERLFLALTVAAVMVLSIGGGGGNQRFVQACYQAISTMLVLLVLLRIGLFGSAVMFVTNFVLTRVPFTFDSSSLYFGQALVALAALMGLAAAGFWLARRAPRTAFG
ncbi:MAG TPA: serine/threonine-protein kinase [Vicinamibacterales bacterium]|nr:serine/threonine-protein kinase [Vicinamibacterales bacterium]